MLGFFINMLAAAAPANPQPPAARWIVDWGDQRCSLVRQTGGAKSRTLMVRTVPGTGTAELWLFDPSWSGPTWRGYDRVDVGLDPSGFRVSEPAVSVRFRGQDGLAVTALDKNFLEKLAGARSVAIDRGGARLAEIPVPASDRAVASLNACEDEVMRDWGLDPAVTRSLSRRPEAIGGAAKWLSDRDYPSSALREHQQGSVLTRLVVDPNGRIEQCHIVESSGYPVLDEKTCRVLGERVPFEPALSSAGEKVRAMTSLRIVWRLP